MNELAAAVMGAVRSTVQFGDVVLVVAAVLLLAWVMWRMWLVGRDT